MDEIKNILVTGATGLIGSALVRRLILDKRFVVYASGRNEERAQRIFSDLWGEERFHFVRHDITLPLKGDIVFHYIIDAASGANPQLYSTDPVGVMKGNLLGVCNLLDYGAGHGLEKFLYISSGESYGEGDGRVFLEEYSGYVDSMSFRSCYPSSKRAAETLCACYAHQYGISCVVARPCHVYGPGFTEDDNRVYAQFIRNVLRDEDIVMKSSGSQFRSWIYVEDCVDALLCILERGESCQAYNIADEGCNISIRQLAEMIAEIGHRRVVVDVPDDVEKAGYNPVSKSVFSTAKLRNLGWSVSGTMYDKLKTTIDNCKHGKG